MNETKWIVRILSRIFVLYTVRVSVCRVFRQYFGWTYHLNSYGTYQWSFVRNKTMKQQYFDGRRHGKSNVISGQRFQARFVMLTHYR